MIKYETIQQECHVCDNCGKVLELGYDDYIIVTPSGKLEFCETCMRSETDYCGYCNDRHLYKDIYSFDVAGKEIEVCYFSKDHVLKELEDTISQINFNFN